MHEVLVIVFVLFSALNGVSANYYDVAPSEPSMKGTIPPHHHLVPYPNLEWIVQYSVVHYCCRLLIDRTIVDSKPQCRAVISIGR